MRTTRLTILMLLSFLGMSAFAAHAESRPRANDRPPRFCAWLAPLFPPLAGLASSA